MNNAPRPIVHVTRHFEATPERVFDAWLDPAMIGRFMFGSALREEEILHLTVDARVGGQFSFLVRRQGTDIDHVGRYLEIDRPRRLAFTWGIGEVPPPEESRVAVDIVPLGAGCALTLMHDMHPKWAEYVDRTKQGWTAITGALVTALG